MKKQIITFALLFFSLAAFAQEEQIVKLLNEELEKEIQYFKENGKVLNDDGIPVGTFAVIQPFSISADSVLSIEVQYNGYRTIRQEVPLNKITGLSRDVNTLFSTSYHDVTIIKTEVYDYDRPSETDTSYSDLFFINRTYFLTDMSWKSDHSEFWQDEMIEAFKKAGYEIAKGGWYN